MSALLYVWIYPEAASEPVLCGVLECLQGRRCLFSYDSAWLAHPQAFALAPDMPLGKGVIQPPAGLDLHPVFEDAGPDRWGKNVINKVFNPQTRSPLDYLELAGEDRIGALGFSRSATSYQVAAQQSFDSADLSELLRAANALMAHDPIDDALRRLLRPGSSAGGAVPKAIIRHQGADWIAKFPGEDDDCDVAALEHASLRLAAQCGIEVPESQLLKIGRTNVFLVKRFDRDLGRRIHYASARTMLIAEGISEDEMAYADLADAARRWCAGPKWACQQLFRRMVLNVLLENTDDHAKNHAFLYRHQQWHLSPAFDIQPQRQGIGYHQLRIGKQGHAPSLSNCRDDAGRFLLKQEEARKIVDEMLKQAREWKTLFAANGVNEADIELCARYVMRPALLD